MSLLELDPQTEQQLNRLASACAQTHLCKLQQLVISCKRVGTL